MLRLLASSVVLSALTNTALAQSPMSFDDIGNNLRVESRGDIHFLFGLDVGRPYARALNVSGAPIIVDVEITTLVDPSTGRKTISERSLDVPAYTASGSFYPEYYDKKPSWITGWRVRSGQAGGRTPVARAAKPFFRVHPQYPTECLDADIEGDIVVTFDISKRGTAENVVPLGVTDRCFIEATKSVVTGWLYEPELEAGRPVRKENVETLVRFILDY